MGVALSLMVIGQYQPRSHGDLHLSHPIEQTEYPINLDITRGVV